MGWPNRTKAELHDVRENNWVSDSTIYKLNVVLVVFGRRFVVMVVPQDVITNLPRYWATGLG